MCKPKIIYIYIYIYIYDILVYIYIYIYLKVAIELKRRYCEELVASAVESSGTVYLKKLN